ncbi:MAG: glycosyltransferase, partial [Candidatus Omnitrophica bacterium]|nr:glycosyltransferase [Candidatus Omnitrophota bacterium]
RVIHHNINQGLGAVYRTGFKEARGEYITFFPADGQFPADILKQYSAYLGTYDMILGFIPERKDSFRARCLSAFERILLWALFGPLPRFQGILMFNRSLLNDIRLSSSGRGWTILMELIIKAKRAGRTMISVPIGFRPRAFGHSKVNNIPNILDNLKQIVILKWEKKE